MWFLGLNYTESSTKWGARDLKFAQWRLIYLLSILFFRQPPLNLSFNKRRMWDGSKTIVGLEIRSVKENISQRNVFLFKHLYAHSIHLFFCTLPACLYVKLHPSAQGSEEGLNVRMLIFECTSRNRGSVLRVRMEGEEAADPEKMGNDGRSILDQRKKRNNESRPEWGMHLRSSECMMMEC